MRYRGCHVPISSLNVCLHVSHTWPHTHWDAHHPQSAKYALFLRPSAHPRSGVACNSHTMHGKNRTGILVSWESSTGVLLVPRECFCFAPRPSQRRGRILRSSDPPVRTRVVKIREAIIITKGRHYKGDDIYRRMKCTRQ